MAFFLLFHSIASSTNTQEYTVVIILAVGRIGVEYLYEMMAVFLQKKKNGSVNRPVRMRV